MVGRLLSFWDGFRAVAMLVWGRVSSVYIILYNYPFLAVLLFDSWGRKRQIDATILLSSKRRVTWKWKKLHCFLVECGNGMPFQGLQLSVWNMYPQDTKSLQSKSISRRKPWVKSQGMPYNDFNQTHMMDLNFQPLHFFHLSCLSLAGRFRVPLGWRKWSEYMIIVVVLLIDSCTCRWLESFQRQRSSLHVSVAVTKPFKANLICLHMFHFPTWRTRKVWLWLSWSVGVGSTDNMSRTNSLEGTPENRVQFAGIFKLHRKAGSGGLKNTFTRIPNIPVVCNLWGIISLWGSCRVRIDNGSPPTKGKHTLKRPFLFSKSGCAACFAVFGASWYFGYSPTSW